MGVKLGPPNISAYGARSMGITVTLDPSPLLLVSQFDRLGLDIRSFKEPLRQSIQEIVAPSLRKNFYAQGRPDRWPQLAEQTVQQKSATGHSGNAPFPLVRTGKLRRVAGQLNLWRIDGIDGIATVDLPSDVWYGAVHQEGSNEGTNAVYKVRSRSGGTRTVERGDPGRVPQRIWAIIQDEDVDGIERVFEKWIQGRLVAHGFRPGM
jgi:phage gpG-like protein